MSATCIAQEMQIDLQRSGGFGTGSVKGLRNSGPEKLQVVQEWPRPRSLLDLGGLLGLVEFFKRCMKTNAEIASSLTDMTTKNMYVAIWDERCSKAFSILNEALTSGPVLISPHWETPILLHIDAYVHALGAALP